MSVLIQTITLYNFVKTKFEELEMHDNSRKVVKSLILFLVLLMPSTLSASPRFHLLRAVKKAARTVYVWQHKPWFQPIEHEALGAGIAFAVSASSGNAHNWKPGLVGASIVAAAKEGTDLHDKRDSRKSALKDTLEIIAGAVAYSMLVK